jgi:protein O-GlcNAc transferase
VLFRSRKWASIQSPAGPQRKVPLRPTKNGRRLRIGYISGFFHKENWMKPVWGLINCHDRDQFEIHLFSDTAESEIGEGYNRHPRDRFHNIGRLPNDEVARRIEEAAIDIAVDLNGYSCVDRLPLFIGRPAPIIVGWFNMYATTGMDCFDYLIGDQHVIPAEEEKYYTEKIVRVPGSYLTFTVNYPAPEVAPPPCVANGYITFGSLASQYKVTNEVVGAWSRILRECPESKLLLKNRALGSAGNRAFVLKLFAGFGVSAERLQLEGPSEHFAFLQMYGQIDLSLDTFPYNGGTTTMEALWQGVPVLTFWGDRWASRTSASILRTAQLGEFVAGDLEGHVNQAIAMARAPQTPARLGELRMGLRERLARSPVCDTAGFARNIENLYVRMWEGQAPG